jgi:hypothetical protein
LRTARTRATTVARRRGAAEKCFKENDEDDEDDEDDRSIQ